MEDSTEEFLKMVADCRFFLTTSRVNLMTGKTNANNGLTVEDWYGNAKSDQDYTLLDRLFPDRFLKMTAFAGTIFFGLWGTAIVAEHYLPASSGAKIELISSAKSVEQKRKVAELLSRNRVTQSDISDLEAENALYSELDTETKNQQVIADFVKQNK
jgi:hypothetical protein